jgi:hypothetical protein
MGGGSNNAQRSAEARERQREATINRNTVAVNNIYDSPERQAQIGQFTDAIRQQYQTELQEQQRKNNNQLQFSLARSGQTGSSLDRDQNRQLGEAYQRGVLESERGAQNAAADLRAADEASRNQLLGLVQSGSSGAVALQNAATAQRNNLLAAKSSVDVRNIGDAYSNFSDIFNRSKQQSEYRRGLQDYGNEFGFLGNGGKT